MSPLIAFTLPRHDRPAALAVIFAVAASLVAVARLLGRRHPPPGAGLIPRERWTLDQAAAYGDAARIAELIASGVSAAELTVALHSAVTNLSPRGVRCLLDAGADANAVIGHGPTPLRSAIETEADEARGRDGAEPEITAILIERGADVNRPAAGDAETPIRTAKRLGHAKAMTLLLRHGATP